MLYFITETLGTGNAKIRAVWNQSWILFCANSLCAILSLLIFWVLQLLEHLRLLVLLHSCNGRGDRKSLGLDSLCDSYYHNNKNESFHSTINIQVSDYLKSLFQRCMKHFFVSCLQTNNCILKGKSFTLPNLWVWHWWLC